DIYRAPGYTFPFARNRSARLSPADRASALRGQRAAIPPSRSAACKRYASGNARRRAGPPFRPTRGVGRRRRRALSRREQSFRIDLASQRKGALRQEWQQKRDRSSSLDASWELRFQQSPNKRELILYVNHQQQFETDATL